MPVVPTTSGRRVQSRGVQTGGFQTFDVPQAGQVLANVADQYAVAYGEAGQKANVAMAQEALLQFNQFADDQINNPENGLISKQGKNALGQSDAVMKNMQERAQALLGSIPESEERNKLSFQLQQSMQSYYNQARRYEVGQFQQFQDQTYLSGNALAVTQSAGLYSDNQAFVDLAKQRFESIDQYADAHGLPDEWRVQQKTQLKEQMGQQAWIGNIAQKYNEFLQVNGEPGDLDGVSRAISHGNSLDARGLRNNNPGNIEASKSNPWEGQIGSDGRFATFATPEHGIRALGKNMLSYQRQGYDTVSEIVNAMLRLVMVIILMLILGHCVVSLVLGRMISLISLTQRH